MPPWPPFTSSPAHTAHEEGQEYQSPKGSRPSLDWRRGVGWPGSLAHSRRYDVRPVSRSVCLQEIKWNKWTCSRSSICIHGCTGFSPAQLQGPPSTEYSTNATAPTLQAMQRATSELSVSTEFIAMSLSFHFMMSQRGSRGFSSGSVVKNLPAMQENQAGDMGLIPGSGRSLGERKWQPTPVVLPGNSQSMVWQKRVRHAWTAKQEQGSKAETGQRYSESQGCSGPQGCQLAGAMLGVSTHLCVQWSHAGSMKPAAWIIYRSPQTG